MEKNNDLLRVLTREGVLINVSVHFWRGCKKLKPEDLGLSASKVSDRLISLGHKRLLPREATAALALIESRAHAVIDTNTFPFLNGLAHFVPNTKLNETTSKLKELEAEFWKAKEAFINDYGELRESAAREWQAMARKLVADPDRLVASIEAAFPLIGRMDRFFGYDIQLFQIAVPERLGLDLVAEGDQQELIEARHRAAHQAADHIRRTTERFVADCVTSLRAQTAQLCDEMLESIRTSETGVHQKTLNRLVKFIDQFKQMNFAEDGEMERVLDQTRRELLARTAEEYRDDDFARKRLVDGLSRLSNKAREMARQDATELVQRFGELGRRRFHLAA